MLLTSLLPFLKVHVFFLDCSFQGFPKSSKGWKKGGIRNFAEGGGIFFTKWWEPGEEWFWPFEPFAKLKIGFCEYWTSNKIEISMTCASKEYQIKTKMVQEQWLQLKMKFLLGNNFKVVI